MLSTIFWVIVAAAIILACMYAVNVGYKIFYDYMQERMERRAKKGRNGKL